MRFKTLILVSLAALVMVAGCGSSGADTGADRAGRTTDGDRADTRSDDGGLEGCLVGRWQPDFDRMVAMMGVPAESGLGVSGSFVLEFKQGGDFVLDIDIDSSGVGEAGEEFAGNTKNTADGTWTVSGDELTVTIAHSQATLTETVDGVVQPVDESGPDFSKAFGPDNPLMVTCSSATLVLDAGSDSEFPVQRL